MPKRTVIFLCLFGWFLLAGSLRASMREMNPPEDPRSTRLLALTGARLIDGYGGPPVESATVLIKGSRIEAAGPRSTISIPPDAIRLDVTGMSLLPGLIDTHFHSRDDAVRPVEFELKNGITSFRDPGHPFKYYEVALNADGPMPRIFLCGGHLDGAPPVWPDQAVVPTTAEEARQAVFSHVARSASAIKVYLRLPLDHIRAACEAAREKDVLVTAHLELVEANDAIRAGVRGIEHITSFGTALAGREDALYFKSQIAGDSGARRKLRPWLWSRIELEDNPRVDPLIRLLVETQTFVSPTLAIYESRAGEKNGTAATERGFQAMLDFTGLLHEAGVRITVGSHTAAPYAGRGQAYQREMELLVAAGMTPLEVITAASLRGAEFLDIQDRLGTVEAGKTADLVLVAGDPSQNIAAMAEVRRVMLNGEWVAGDAF